MMRRLQGFIFLMILSSVSIAQNTFDYEIEGVLKGLKNDTLYLAIRTGGDSKPQMIPVAGNDDKISYKGQATEKSLVWAQLNSKRRNLGNFTFFLDNGKIKINGNIDSLTSTRVTGTPANNDYSYIIGRMNSYYDKRSAAWERMKVIGDTSKVEYKKEIRKIALLMDSLERVQIEFVAKNPASPGSGMILLLIADKIPVYELEKLYTAFSPEVKQLSILSKIPSRIEAKKKSIVGSAAPVFTMKDISGKDVALADYKGKYVLLDFWASWCVPCRKDNPYVKAAYEKYKDKNFVVISVSVDEDGKKWKEAVVKDELPFVHISDLKKENKVAQLYGVQPIPDNFLISPDGKIIERGLHGEGLDVTLSKILK